MGIGKEEIYNLRHVMNQMRRIYPDACDVGVFETPAIAETLRNSLAVLKSLEGVYSTRWGNAAAGGVACLTRIGFEEDGGYVRGLRIRVTRNWNRRYHKAAFYTVEMAPATWRPDSKVNEFGPLYEMAV